MYPYRPPGAYSRRITRVFIGAALLGLILILTARPGAVSGGIGVALCTGVTSAAFVIDWWGVITLRGLLDWPRIHSARRLGLVVAWICLFPAFFCLYLVRVAIDLSGPRRPSVSPARARAALLVGSLVLCLGLLTTFGSATDESLAPSTQLRTSAQAGQAPAVPGGLITAPTATRAPAHARTPGPELTLTPRCVAINQNPWCDNFQPGKRVHNPPTSFCTYFKCVASFWKISGGYVTECKDGVYTRSGGRPGNCSHHGGVWRPLYSH